MGARNARLSLQPNVSSVCDLRDSALGQLAAPHFQVYLVMEHLCSMLKFFRAKKGPATRPLMPQVYSSRFKRYGMQLSKSTPYQL